jgi:hypothetical protein
LFPSCALACGRGCFILLVGYYLQIIKESNLAFGAVVCLCLQAGLEMRVALQKSAMQGNFLYMAVSAVKLSNTVAFAQFYQRYLTCT